MKRGADLAAQFPGLFLVHHNKPGDHVNSHHHDEHHLIVPLRGEVSIRTADATVVVAPGRMIYIPSTLEHEFHSTNEKEGERLIALIDRRLWERVDGARSPLRVLPAHQLCQEILYFLLLNPKSKLVRGLIETFVVALSEALDANASAEGTESVHHLSQRAKDPRVRKVLDTLEKEFAQDLRVSELSKTAGLSQRNLNRLFVQELGIGPKEILIRLRLEEAKRLLVEERKCVTEACFEVGYTSLSRFIQSFRAHFGRLPSDYLR